MSQPRRAALAIAAAAALAGAAAWLIFLRPGGGGERTYYYDLSAERLFAAPDNQPLPIPGVDGPERDGVLAFVITCTGDCSPDARRIAFLVSHTDEYATLMAERLDAERRGERGPDRAYDRAFQEVSTLYRRPDGDAWHNGASAEAAAIFAALTEPCPDGSSPLPCRP